MDTDRLMEFLSKEGFRPSLSEAGDIHFKYEGGHYGVRVAADDSQWVEIVYPNFWEIRSPEEEVRALRAANETSQTTKIVKIHVIQSQHNVWAEAELLVLGPDQFEALFSRTLAVLKAGVGRFVELMRKSEPVPDKPIELRREEVIRRMHGN